MQMPNFEPVALTRLGRKVLAQGQTGLPIRFTRVTVGDGRLPPGAVTDNMTGMVHAVKNLPINGNTIIGDGTTQLDCLLSNRDLAVMLELREIGLFARDNDNGNEILYAYTNAGDLPDYIPAGGGPHAVELLLSIVTVIRQAANIVVNITEGYGFVTPAQLETRILDLYRPHGKPVGLWTWNDADAKKLRPTPIAANEPVLIGWNPAVKDFFFFPLSRVLTYAERLRGGTPAMQTAAYPDGRVTGGTPGMAVTAYPDGRVRGGDPLTW
jgi:hypothetical protein